MAWINREFAHNRGGAFILRFDDIAPRVVGEDPTKMPQWAVEAEAILRQAGLAPDRVTRLSSYAEPEEDFADKAGGRNFWHRSADREGHLNLMCCPSLARLRVRADIAEEIGAVIRGEDLLVELQLYEHFNAQLGGAVREMVFLPRLRVQCGGEVTTLSKTVGNMQLRDLFAVHPAEWWLARMRETILVDPAGGVEWGNLNPDPIFEVD